MTRFRLPLRTRFTVLWLRLTRRAIPYRDTWTGRMSDLWFGWLNGFVFGVSLSVLVAALLVLATA